ncbi:transcriptional regulatory [Fusarium albosuccineum]|uniref:Transcriptional regulatory n=1 Tax=Fusarium albosuccineum TaxID=1237068 RepID=A0A8H4KQL3_9HYPO|nr:transcriptional regulatory [Fusarium albosuccineum]
MQQQAPNERPYRSHLRPACLPCRRRKSRCQSEASSETCLMCRAHCTDCVFPPGPSSGANRTPETRRRRQTRSTSGPGTPRRRSLAPGPLSGDSILEQPDAGPESVSIPIPIPTPVHVPPPSNPIGVSPVLSRNAECTVPNQNGQENESPLALASSDEQQHNLHIVGPAVTSDNQVLSDYLSAMPSATRGSRMVIPVPGNRSRPVLFTMVQKRPLGLDSNRSLPAEKVQLIEKILEPFVTDVLDVYFQKVNSSFPLLDEASFCRQYHENRDGISPALLACLYAHSMTFWDSSPALNRHRCPDRRFIWNLATEATYSQLHRSPGMSIIEAILLNVGGRPTTSLIGNGVLLGSAVAMAYSLGLNHNPIPWEIPQSEKNLRMKIWTSLSHGTPPHISNTQYDVPQPTVENLCDEGSSRDKILKASVYVALVGLTEVLDLNLRHIHRFSNSEETRDTTHLELALNNWVESLSDDIRRIIIRGTNLDIPGAANLRLAYLTARLLLQRIELEAEKRIYDAGDSRLLNRYMQARRTSEEILILTQELQPEHLSDFWLPSSAFAFPATVSFLLRCALETENSPAGLAQSSSLKIASDLLTSLRSHQEKHAWDLGDICLAQHTEVIDKLLAMAPPEDQGPDGSLDLADFVMPDASFIDQFFPSLWDPLQNAW